MSLKKEKSHTVQKDTDDLRDIFFIKMVSHAEENSPDPAKLDGRAQAVYTITDDK